MLPLEITSGEARALIDSGEPVRLIDVRELDEWAICHLQGAELIPLSRFVQMAERKLPDRNERLLIYCHHGLRSLRAAEWLSARGYANVQNLSGGIDQWAAKIDRSLTRY
jgi:rhodanese-related sulfurtransferase